MAALHLRELSDALLLDEIWLLAFAVIATVFRSKAPSRLRFTLPAWRGAGHLTDRTGDTGLNLTW